MPPRSRWSTTPAGQQRQHLGDLRRAPQVGRQQRRGEAFAVAAVIDPRRGPLHRARAGDDLAGGLVAVADHQPSPGRVDLVDVGVEVGAPLGLGRHREHVLGGQPAQLSQAHRAAPRSTALQLSGEFVAGRNDDLSATMQ